MYYACSGKNEAYVIIFFFRYRQDFSKNLKRHGLHEIYIYSQWYGDYCCKEFSNSINRSIAVEKPLKQFNQQTVMLKNGMNFFYHLQQQVFVFKNDQKYFNT